MDRERFELLLEAYGADFSRWPADERDAAAAFAAQNGDALAGLLAEARSLDTALDPARAIPDASALMARVLAAAPRAQRPAFDRRAMMALAACAVFGVVLGYGAGMLAPVADQDDAYFATAFEAPFAEALGDEG